MNKLKAELPATGKGVGGEDWFDYVALLGHRRVRTQVRLSTVAEVYGALCTFTPMVNETPLDRPDAERDVRGPILALHLAGPQAIKSMRATVDAAERMLLWRRVQRAEERHTIGLALAVIRSELLKVSQ